MNLLHRSLPKTKTPLISSESSHLFVLVSLFIAQPLFAVLSKNPAFFTIRHIEKGELLMLITLIIIGLPSVLLVFQWVGRLVHFRLQKALHLLLIAALFSLGVFQAFSKATWLTGEQCILVAMVGSLLFTFFYYRFHAVRLFMTFLSVGIVIVPLQFLLGSEVRRALRTNDSQIIAASKPGDTPPIVFIILDEFPLFPLLNENLEINKERFPNFFSLSQESYWFRNATTVSDYTELAIPAILTGNFPIKRSLPSATEHPKNLFTALAPYYKINAHESITNLCPEHVCNRLVQKPSLIENLTSIIKDLVAVYLHIVVPAEFSGSLPDISSAWSGFWKEKRKEEKEEKLFDFKKEAFLALEDDRPGLIKQFIGTIAPSTEPTLHFLHVLFPHNPWNYLPSGKLYTSDELEGRGQHERWVEDEVATTEALRRHLFQIQYLDKLIGALTFHLKEQGLYDKTLLVITSDHGVSFQPGDLRRPLTETNYYDLLPIPLFVKLPDQNKGVINDNNVQVIDILPTIAEVLKTKLPWKLDGASLFSSPQNPKTKKYFYNNETGVKLSFENNLFRSSPSVKKLNALFNGVSSSYDIYSGAIYPELLGKSLSQLTLSSGRGDYELVQWDFLKKVDLSKRLLPAHITGQLHFKEGHPSPQAPLALALNGVVQSTTKTFQGNTPSRTFSFFVPEHALKHGENAVALYEIVPDANGSVSLKQLQERRKESFSFEEKDKDKFIVSNTGKKYRITNEKLRGSVDGTKVKNNAILVWGWAADSRTKTLPESIVGFIDNRFLDSKKTSLTRNEISTSYGDWALQSGFIFEFPASSFKAKKRSQVRFYALSKDGHASELHYYQHYPWKPRLRK